MLDENVDGQQFNDVGLFANINNLCGESASPSTGGPVKNELSERDIEIILLGLRDGLTFSDPGELKVDVSNYLPNINLYCSFL